MEPGKCSQRGVTHTKLNVKLVGVELWKSRQADELWEMFCVSLTRTPPRFWATEASLRGR